MLETGVPDHLTCLLRNPYAGQEAVVRTGHGTTDWFKIGKRVHQGYKKYQSFSAQPSLWSNSHINTWLLKKIIVLTIRTFVGKVMSLLFNTLSLSYAYVYLKPSEVYHCIHFAHNKIEPQKYIVQSY